jgi:hypothetical protein
LSQIAKRSGVDLNLLRVVRDDIVGFPRQVSPVNQVNRYYDSVEMLAYLDSGKFASAYEVAAVSYRKIKKIELDIKKAKALIKSPQILNLTLANQFLRRSIIR